MFVWSLKSCNLLLLLLLVPVLLFTQLECIGSYCLWETHHSLEWIEAELAQFLRGLLLVDRVFLSTVLEYRTWSGQVYLNIC